ncbi:MAG: helix-turn-helix domain-containing protein [Candidatus Thiodiazotropha taylori]
MKGSIVSDTNPPQHPGAYVKKRIIPNGVSVKKAAELMGIGRPALSNFLNGKASLSNNMATRLEKALAQISRSCSLYSGNMTHCLLRIRRGG